MFHVAGYELSVSGNRLLESLGLLLRSCNGLAHNKHDKQMWFKDNKNIFEIRSSPATSNIFKLIAT
jgi:hypothetical protein